LGFDRHDEVTKMIAERKVIDVDESPELAHLVDRISESQEATLLRRNGQAVAVITPLKKRRQRQVRVPTQEDVEAFAAAAGGWKGLVDADALIADIYADRDAEIRQPGDR
jgi:antitoxin (DNA-binding transcriptional repressor) of toxin-antitoxin stability system